MSLESGDFNFFVIRCYNRYEHSKTANCGLLRWPCILDEPYKISKPLNTAVGSAPASCWVTSALSSMQIQEWQKVFLYFFVYFLPQPNALRKLIVNE